MYIDQAKEVIRIEAEGVTSLIDQLGPDFDKAIDWVLDGKIPVFDTVERALAATGANCSVLFVPAKYAGDAMLEAADAGVPLIVCITEGVPIHDMMKIRKYLDQEGVRLVGPNCPGLLTLG